MRPFSQFSLAHDPFWCRYFSEGKRLQCWLCRSTPLPRRLFPSYSVWQLCWKADQPGSLQLKREKGSWVQGGLLSSIGSNSVFTYRWPLEQRWHERCHTGWTVHSHWLLRQTEQLAHKNRIQRRLPTARSRATKTAGQKVRCTIRVPSPTTCTCHGFLFLITVCKMVPYEAQQGLIFSSVNCFSVTH